MEMYLGMSREEANSEQNPNRGLFAGVGGQLKEKGTSHWKPPNTEANNETGFTALPGLSRSLEGNFLGIKGGKAYFWTATIHPGWQHIPASYFRALSYSSPGISRVPLDSEGGISVRCIRDE